MEALLYEERTSIGFRVCNICKVEKRLSEFSVAKADRKTAGFSGRCKECNRARWKLYKQNNLQRVKEMQRAWDTEVMHYGIDEKYGDTWEHLHVVLSVTEWLRMGTHYSRA